jgi:pimeloyl-ACP methyl ester carboxylesterase
VSPTSAQTSAVKHRFVEANGIRMHIAEQGEGPLVLLAHGFPELWYSWRHVLPALAAAGYHAVAPDMRGYGQTDAPPNISDYTQLQIAGDLVGLVRALGYDQAVVAGHGAGALLCRQVACADQGDSKLAADPGDGEIFVVLAAFDSDLR